MSVDVDRLHKNLTSLPAQEIAVLIHTFIQRSDKSLLDKNKLKLILDYLNLAIEREFEAYD